MSRITQVGVFECNVIILRKLSYENSQLLSSVPPLCPHITPHIDGHYSSDDVIMSIRKRGSLL